MTSIALITGITGQDGPYLAELLLDKGYEVHGLIRPSRETGSAPFDLECYDQAIREKRLVIHRADLSDTATIRQIVKQVQPTEFYHLAAQTDVGISFEIPEATAELNAMATLRILEILRDQPKPPRFLHASSREIFGTPTKCPQDEQTPMRPNSPYGCSKAFATQLVWIYREAHGLFCCNAICYNHESPRRTENFVTRKITLAVARIKAGLQHELLLGNLAAARDWGYAKDFVLGMWKILQQEKPDDFVLATGTTHTVKDFLRIAFQRAGLDWKQFTRIDDRFRRPVDACQLCGDARKANLELGWEPSISFEDLVHLMVDHDLELVSTSDRDRTVC